MTKKNILWACGISALTLLSSCDKNSSLVFVGSTTEKPSVPLMENERFPMSLDYCNGFTPVVNLDINHSDTIHIAGWALDPQSNGSLSKLIIKANSNYIEANYGLERADVMAATNSSSPALGFEASFSKSLLQDENGYVADHIDIIAVTSSGQYEPASFAIMKEPTIPNLPVHEKNYQIAEGGIFVDNAVNNVISVKESVEQTTRIYGWAFDSETMSHLSGIYAKVGIHTFAGAQAERVDVQQVFSLNDSQVGFYFEIPTSLLKDPSVKTFDIIGIGTNGEYAFTPKTYPVENE